jgi:hypothetical protein
MPIIRPIPAFETETVEIRWTLRDGGAFVQRVTIPPPIVRVAADAQARRASAAQLVRLTATVVAPAVVPELVEAICGALGEISLEEALAALDRLQQEAAPRE